MTRRQSVPDATAALSLLCTSQCVLVCDCVRKSSAQFSALVLKLCFPYNSLSHKMGSRVVVRRLPGGGYKVMSEVERVGVRRECIVKWIGIKPWEREVVWYGGKGLSTVMVAGFKREE
ncbi:hypothetical protein Tco_0651912 [Tanacetum coccineum]|uniref:Uncharacterized protein n=1 Tax=Tanacetum coccineum TaxID=301880 RepID=A0ABQ4WWF0_9ASTR